VRFLITNTDYPEFLGWLYDQNPELGEKSFDQQMRVRSDSLFGVADFYSSNLRKIGHEAWDVHANNEFMQKAWAKEHGHRLASRARRQEPLRMILQQGSRVALKTPVRYLKPLLRPLLRSVNNQPAWFYDILAAQIKHFKPDILFNLDMGISTQFLGQMKPWFRMLVGQIASPLPEEENLGCYDLVISSLPNFVEYFARKGVRAELHRFAFEPNILSNLNGQTPKIPVSFVGSFTQQHNARIKLLEHLCREVEVNVWGREVEALPKTSPIRERYLGQAWGTVMYQILHSSKITLNHHIGVAESYANNMRLFEATGAGAMLLTDWKINLHEMFEDGKEVVTYRTPKECAALVQYYLNHEHERESIARSGQQRTLRENTYYQRAQELSDIVFSYL
jgi:spore maturation protein CgeB